MITTEHIKYNFFFGAGVSSSPFVELICKLKRAKWMGGSIHAREFASPQLAIKQEVIELFTDDGTLKTRAFRAFTVSRVDNKKIHVYHGALALSHSNTHTMTSHTHTHTGGKCIVQVSKVYLCGVYGKTETFASGFSSLVLDGLDVEFTAACFDFPKKPSDEVRWWVHADILKNPKETAYVLGDIKTSGVIPVFVHLAPVLCFIFANEGRLGPGAIGVADVAATDVRRRLPKLVWMQAFGYTVAANDDDVKDTFRKHVRDLCLLVGATPSARSAPTQDIRHLVEGLVNFIPV